MPDETVTYVYDANDRLLTETKDASGTADDRFTRYEYGPGETVLPPFGGSGTQQTKKTVRQGLDDSGNKVEEHTYSYNLQGRMSRAIIDEDGNGVADKKLDYEYGDDGIRVSQTETTDTDHDGSFADETAVETQYLNDKQNATGYSQVLEEKAGWGNVTKTYTLGHDIIAQADASNAYFLLKDGHGSTRALVNSSGQIVAGQVYSYDAFGNAIGFNPSQAATAMLYSGEHFDVLTCLQYLRARYYDPNAGRFNTLDPYTGDIGDPLTLHKYLYCSNDTINRSDPTGQFWGAVAVIGIGAIIGGVAGWWHGGDWNGSWSDIAMGAGLGALGGALGFLSFGSFSALFGMFLSEAGTFWAATLASGAFTGAALEGIQSYMAGNDEEEILWDMGWGSLEGMVLSGLFAGGFLGARGLIGRFIPRPPATLPPPSAAAPPAQQIGPNFRAGNRIFRSLGRTFHLRPGDTPSQIPISDPVGDAVETAANQARANYAIDKLLPGERAAVLRARAVDAAKADQLEAMYRGHAIQREVANQFPNLDWTPRGTAGLDAYNPLANIYYEITTDTMTALVSHAYREVNNSFRFILYPP